MSFKSLFIKDDSEQDSTKPVDSGKNTATTAPSAMPITSQVVSNMTGVADEKFVEMLMGVIAQNNIPGQDYFEFKQTFDAMGNLPIDERTKFITIYTTFQLQGCSKEALMASIDKYIAIVNSEKDNFDAELKSQKDATVTSKMNQIEEAKKKLEQLSKEITETNAFILTTSQEVQSADLKLQMTDANFKKSVEKVIGILTADKEKINSYIQ